MMISKLPTVIIALALFSGACAPRKQSKVTPISLTEHLKKDVTTPETHPTHNILLYLEKSENLRAEIKFCERAQDCRRYPMVAGENLELKIEDSNFYSIRLCPLENEECLPWQIILLRPVESLNLVDGTPQDSESFAVELSKSSGFSIAILNQSRFLFSVYAAIDQDALGLVNETTPVVARGIVNVGNSCFLNGLLQTNVLRAVDFQELFERENLEILAGESNDAFQRRKALFTSAKRIYTNFGVLHNDTSFQNTDDIYKFMQAYDDYVVHHALSPVEKDEVLKGKANEKIFGQYQKPWLGGERTWTYRGAQLASDEFSERLARFFGLGQKVAHFQGQLSEDFTRINHEPLHGEIPKHELTETQRKEIETKWYAEISEATLFQRQSPDAQAIERTRIIRERWEKYKSLEVGFNPFLDTEVIIPDQRTRSIQELVEKAYYFPDSRGMFNRILAEGPAQEGPALKSMRFASGGREGRQLAYIDPVILVPFVYRDQLTAPDTTRPMLVSRKSPPGWLQADTPTHLQKMVLKGVSIHHGGKNGSGGHYTGYASQPDGTWFHYDDSVKPRQISSNEMQGLLSGVFADQGTIFYYEPVEAPILWENKPTLLQLPDETPRTVALQARIDQESKQRFQYPERPTRMTKKLPETSAAPKKPPTPEIEVKGSSILPWILGTAVTAILIGGMTSYIVQTQDEANAKNAEEKARKKIEKAKLEENKRKEIRIQELIEKAQAEEKWRAK